MIDLHTHILPGLDDGAQDIDDALGLAELAVEGGVYTLVATPHSNQKGRFENYAGDKLQAVYQKLQQEINKEHIPLKVLLGMEIYASEDIKEKIENGLLIGLNHTKYYLVEFPFECEQYWIGQCLEDILDCGKIPLIAHPERYMCVQEYPALLYEWIRMGCFSQINKGSLFGKFGKRAYVAAHVLMQNQLVTCVASDAHTPYMRTTYMRDVKEYIEDEYGGKTAVQLLEKNPKKILHGEILQPNGKPPERRRRFFW